MMGHRGVRLGVTFPEITEMQVRAILEAAAELRQAGKKCFPEIMVPVTCAKAELDDQLEHRQGGPRRGVRRSTVSTRSSTSTAP